MFKVDKISTSYNGFKQLIDLDMAIRDAKLQELDGFTIDFQNKWIDANMCASLGSIIDLHVSDFKNSITLINLSEGAETVLKKNNFLSYFGGEKLNDTYHTTIEYQPFRTSDNVEFIEYVKSNFTKHGKGIPRMSPRLLTKFRESIYEIFVNAVQHSETTMGIYACGQWYPNKNRLVFSIVDLGIGFRDNIYKHIKLKLAPDEAIQWAFGKDNTTKHKDKGIPGGMGLKLIKEFLLKNGGQMFVVSDKGYWRQYKSQTYLKSFSNPFPGTIVNIEINTSDTKSYKLVEEVGLSEFSW